MTANDEAPGATGASAENSGEQSNEEVNPLPVADQAPPDGSAQPVTPGHGVAVPGGDIVVKHPDGVSLPESLMVGGRRVAVRPDGFCTPQIKQTKSAIVPISNFVAFVSEHRIRDDGVATVSEFTVNVYHCGRWFRVDVAADDFAQLRWLNTDVGPTAIIYPRSRELVLAAIQELSAAVHGGPVPLITVHSHLGWKTLPDGTRVFLNAGGALGADGVVPSVVVALPGDFAHYYIGAPGPDEELRESVRASLSIIDLGTETVTAPLLAATCRAPLGDANLTVFMEGLTGSLKSSLAAIVQQHFGSEMDIRHLPGSWSSTDNALEVLAFLAKDCVLVIDDFNPTGSQNEVAAWHAKAERIIRAVANGSGRSRLDANSELEETRPARCLLLATGEDRPRGQSLRARLLGVDVERGQIDLAKLTVAQEQAASGVFSRAMAGYLKWLANNWEAVVGTRVKHSAQLRADLYDIDSHPFTSNIVAELGVGVRTFLDFAVYIDAVSAAEAEELWRRVWQALREVLRHQLEGQGEANPVDKFVRYLASAVSVGRAHVASIRGGPPYTADNGAWGWKKRRGRIIYGPGGIKMDREDDEWEPMGDGVGWVSTGRLYLDPTAAMGAAEKQARQMGDSLGVSALTLGKRMNERGLLRVQKGRGTLKVRRMVDDRRLNVWDLPVSVLGVGVGEDDPDLTDA
jgi:hypothetical protein